MKSIVIACMAMFCLSVSVAQAQSNQGHANQAIYQDSGAIAQVAQVGCCSDPVCGCEGGCASAPAYTPAPSCGLPGGCGNPSCGCDVAPSCASPGPSCSPDPTCGMDNACGPAGCDMGVPSCGMPGPSCGMPGPSCGCDAGGGCDGGCFGGGGGDSDPFSLFGQVAGFDVGGWVQFGYHENSIPLFNNHAGRVNVHQAWLYAEKVADGSSGLGLGGRIDYVYGVDAQDTQAFGIADDHWDNDWDNGIYGHAIPQLYGEAAYGNVSVKAGHFYTIIGYEVVTAPDNFFYSHAYTTFNSEPFTHTGALATITPNDNLTIWAGYVLGWDSGFADNGSAFLGGASLSLSDNFNITYTTVAGRFAEDALGNSTEEGYMHSIVGDLTLSDNLQYIIQSDFLDTTDANDNGVRNSIGVNNYLIYTVNDNISVGARYEWWQQEGIFSNFGTEADIHALTLGLNYKPCGNAIIRPEVRWDWDDDLVLDLEEGDSQTTFGIDTILLF